MKIKVNSKTLMIGAIVLVLYFFIGHGFVEFHLSGKNDMLQNAARINNLCNANAACPLALDGWHGDNGRLRKGPVLYIAEQPAGNENAETSSRPQSFKLIYQMPHTADDWFEAQGGVGKQVTSGWKGR